MGNVKCVVEECKYNKNHLCHAGGIEVRSSGDMSVETSDGTACETFAPRE
ncbi:DUF1540 domain-containing protein [Candidatus Formimonas warabiya]|nr:DUF1540 domain-containing protein [Candidatus Formimonas warabiya]